MRLKGKLFHQIFYFNTNFLSDIFTMRIAFLHYKLMKGKARQVYIKNIRNYINHIIMKSHLSI